MVGQSILLKVAEGDTIRLKNFGGDIYEDESTRKENFLHFTGVLLYSSDRSWMRHFFSVKINGFRLEFSREKDELNFGKKQ